MVEASVQTSPVPVFLDTLVDRLELRPNLSGVSVTSAEVAIGAGEYLMFIEAQEAQRWGSNARLRRESTITLEGIIYTVATGAGEQIIRVARRRAYELLGEVEKELRGSTFGHVVAGIDGLATVESTEVTDIDLDQGVNKGQRWASLRFVVSARATTVMGEE